MRLRTWAGSYTDWRNWRPVLAGWIRCLSAKLAVWVQGFDPGEPNDMVELIAAPQNGGPEKPDVAAGSIVTIVTPGRWLLFVAPEHPAYADLLAEEMRGWSSKALADFLAAPGAPAPSCQIARAELQRRAPRR